MRMAGPAEMISSLCCRKRNNDCDSAQSVKPHEAHRDSKRVSRSTAWASFFALNIFLHGNIIRHMPRAATTLDPFNAVAEPKRRLVLEALADGRC